MSLNRRLDQMYQNTEEWHVGRWRGLMIPIVIVGMVLFVLSILFAEEDFLKTRREGSIAFLSGGVGEREREILKEMGKDYPLKLIFSNKKGEYLSDVIVKILDWNGKTILTTASNGPWLFIDLPTGVYDLEVSLKGDRKKLFNIPVERGFQNHKVLSIQW